MTHSIVASADVSQAEPLAGVSYISVAAKGVVTADSLKVKRQRSQALAEWVTHHADQVSEGDIDVLAGLLSDRDDAVRGWIAGALGMLGHKAERAVPKLQQALAERPCVHQPLASAAAIRLALSRIGVEPVKAVCTDPFGS